MLKIDHHRTSASNFFPHKFSSKPVHRQTSHISQPSRRPKQQPFGLPFIHIVSPRDVAKHGNRTYTSSHTILRHKCCPLSDVFFELSALVLKKIQAWNITQFDPAHRPSRWLEVSQTKNDIDETLAIYQNQIARTLLISTSS